MPGCSDDPPARPVDATVDHPRDAPEAEVTPPPDLPSTPDAPPPPPPDAPPDALPDRSDAPEVPDVLDVRDVPGVPDVPDALDVPGALDVPDVSDASTCPPLGPVCTAEGLCWVTPLPQGNDLHATWGASERAVWSVGAAGTILRYDGRCWSIERSGTTQTLRGVSGTGPGDVWAVGDTGTILHRDAAGWSPVVSGVTVHLNGVWAAAPGDVWAVGGGQSVLRWNGSAWRRVAGDDAEFYALAGVHGTAPDDVHVVGFPHPRRWDGTRFVTNPLLPFYSDENTRAVFAAARDDFWYLTSQRRWMHVTPREATVGAMSGDSAPRPGFGGSGPNDVWLFTAGSAAHWDGRAVTPVPSLTNEWLTGAWSARADLAWAAGYAGRVVRYDGAAWAGEMGLPGADVRAAYFSLWGTGADNIWVARSGRVPRVERWDGARWSPMAMPLAADESVVRIWGSGPDDVWALVRGALVCRVLHWTRGAWGESYLNAQLYDLHGSASDDVTVVGDTGLIAHWNGSAWTTTRLGTASLQRVVMTGRNQGWAVTSRDTLYRCVDGVWSDARQTVGPLSAGVFALGPNDVWVAGYDAYHYDGRAWTRVAGGMQNVSAVWAAAPDDVWFVGPVDRYYHWDGRTLETRSTGVGVRLASVWGASARDIWFAGPNGALLRRQR